MRLIDANNLYCGCRYNGECWSNGCEECSDYVISKKYINEQPTIEIPKRPKGKWIINFYELFPEDSNQECSLCHKCYELVNDFNYCPNCGAIVLSDQYDYTRLTPSEITDELIEALWEDLEDVPFDEDKNGSLYLAVDWRGFKKGTHREEGIWEWFDERHSKGIGYLLGI